jgi:hypothetical protein
MTRKIVLQGQVVREHGVTTEPAECVRGNTTGEGRMCPAGHVIPVRLFLLDEGSAYA